MVESVDGRGKSTVQAEDRILDKGGEGKVVKEVCKAFPDVCVAVLPQAFVIESINLRNLPALVVASENGHSVLVSDLHRYQQSDGLYAIVSTIYIVAHEEIVCIGGIAANAKQLREIVELSMDITAYCHWTADRLNIGFLHEHLAGLVAQPLDVWLGELLARRQVGNPLI